MSGAMLEVRNLTRNFVKKLDLAGRIAKGLGADLRDEVVRAVDDVSFSVERGSVVGLVGESGCGKSTIGRMVAGIIRPTSGDVIYKGSSVDAMASAGRKQAQLEIQMIFQDPY
ncbi:MAG: ATP-binding cassette domain-containing protein, partial [Proteobacteria bacterium]|nr:ATP-binding cassette domain-containing protein [Pseudomonadota bacterium]